MTGWTQAILATAAALGPRAAVTEAAGGASLSYGELARTVRQAARGLRKRGLRPGDPVAVLMRGGCHYPVAVHAVAAAGGTVVSPADPAGLAGLGARIMITDLPGADALAQEVDIRQVYSFADLPGVASFHGLLGAGGPPEPAPPARAPTGAPASRTVAGVRVSSGDVVLVTVADRRAYDPVLAAGAHLIAVCEPSPAGLREAAARFGATLVIDAGPRVDRPFTPHP
ncbi:AMP-binding protein [Nonomuraea sp. NN258]|uniref:AMP-binding protein n=1 Tax=Nonomuraea antri TaxID=2730852 RepID=UPI00156A2E91|nr:AMP-binding protein [Nonomuraea antri]NRQ36367.1 AMP-binding protein [Nonomuraea antri]